MGLGFDASTGFYRVGSGNIGVNGDTIRIGTSGISFGGSLQVNWFTGGAYAAVSTGINGNIATGVLEINNGTPGTLRDISLRNLTASGTIKLGAYTFATLPTPATGMVAYITDCNTATYNATAAAGGANVVKVFYNGTNWVVA